MQDIIKEIIEEIRTLNFKLKQLSLPRNKNEGTIPEEVRDQLCRATKHDLVLLKSALTILLDGKDVEG